MDGHRRFLAQAQSWLGPQGLAIDFKRHECEFPWRSDKEAQERRARALAEVDGLKGGLHYLDIVEEVSSKAPPPSTPLQQCLFVDCPAPGIEIGGSQRERYPSETDIEGDLN